MTSRPRTFHISTYGCQMNFADSSSLSQSLMRQGYVEAEREDDADVIIFNTCSVRAHAEDRVFGRLGEVSRFKKVDPNRRIVVVGCMAQRLGENLLKEAPYVDAVLGPDQMFELTRYLESTDGEPEVDTLLNRKDIDIIEPHRETSYSAFVPISRGCDNFCAYCIVPHVRGRERNHSVSHIRDAVLRMIDDGVVEITLLGQNVNSYIHDDIGFPELLRLLMKETSIVRLRYLTSHPKDMSPELVDVMAEYPDRLMPHVHLPLQAGSDRLLKMMGRRYTRAQYMEKLNYLRERLDYVSVTTDLIVGFPTETEDEFEMTLDAVREIGYDAAFMFRFSPRPGTAAAKLNDDVAETDKIRRLNTLIELQQKIGSERNQREIGRVISSVVEGYSRRSKELARARTDGNKTVLFPATDIKPGEIVKVRVDRADAFTLHGERTEEGI